MSVLIRLAGAAVALALASLAVAPALIPPHEEALPADGRAPQKATAFAALPPVNDKAGSNLLELSPLAPDRSAFDRTTASAPPAPTMEVKLTGIFRVGKELRASLVIDGQSIVVRKGDDTPIGKVKTISAKAVVLMGQPETWLEIFR